VYIVIQSEYIMYQNFFLFLNLGGYVVVPVVRISAKNARRWNYADDGKGKVIPLEA